MGANQMALALSLAVPLPMVLPGLLMFVTGMEREREVGGARGGRGRGGRRAGWL